MWERHLADNFQQALKAGNPWAIAAGVLSSLLLAGIILTLLVNLKKSPSRWKIPAGDRTGTIPVAWNIKLLPLAGLLGLVIAGIAHLLFRAAVPPGPAELVNYRAGSVLVHNTLIQGSFVLAVCLLLKQRYLGLWQLGLNRWKNHYLETGLAVYLSVIPVMMLAAMVAGFFQETVAPDQEIFHLLLRITSLPVSLLSLLVVGLIGPFLEEILFRGFLFPTLRNHFGYKRSLIYSSVVFAGLHQSVTAFLPILVLSLALGYLYEKTGSLWPSITLHATNNMVATLMIIFIGRAV